MGLESMQIILVRDNYLHEMSVVVFRGNKTNIINAEIVLSRKSLRKLNTFGRLSIIL